MRFIKNVFVLLFIVSFLFINSLSADAKTLAGMKQELQEAKDKYESNKNSQKLTEDEIENIKSKIEQLNIEKIKIQEEIEDLNGELIELAESIKKMEKEMKSIINYYQLSSTNSIYMEYAFNAKSYTDFIYRLAIIEQLSKYRKETIEKYNSLIEENKIKLKELTSKRLSLDKLETELSNELSGLGSELKNMSEAAFDIEEEIADLEKQVTLYEKTYKCYDDEEISVCIDRRNNTGIPSAAGFYRPVTAGRINATYGYTSYYGSNFHYGTDIGVSHGTQVYPIADGKVVRVTYRSSCGGNMVFIAHTVNGKKYTSLYAHLASSTVKVGDVVDHNTVIGYSGGVPWIETWDRCSTGAHLHLQIGEGNYMIDYFVYATFTAKSFDPKTVINFPAWHEYFTGR